MKQRRTSLPSDAAQPSAPAHSAPTPAVDSGSSPSAALRERLTQTRARMAQLADPHTKRAPQIDIDWDPEETPTRRYDGEPILPRWYRERARGGSVWNRASDAQPRQRARSREVPIDSEDRAHAQPDATPDTAPRERARSGEVPVQSAREREPEDAHGARKRARFNQTQMGTGLVPLGAQASQPLDPAAFPGGEYAAQFTELEPNSGDDPRASQPPERAWFAELQVDDAPQHEPAQAPEARARARSGEVPIGTSFGQPMLVEPQASDALDPSIFPGARELTGAHAALDPSEFPGASARRRMRELSAAPQHFESAQRAQHIAPISDHPTRAPIGRVFLREVSALREHLRARYVHLEDPDRALRNRAALWASGLLLAAAVSLLFSHGSSSTPEPGTQPAAALTNAPKAVPRSAHIAISSDPSGAQIFIDGQASGKVTPTSISELAVGKHVIGLQLAGYREAKESLRLPEDALLSIKLASLSTPRPASQAQVIEARPQTRAEARARARELARERSASARAARVISRYRTRVGLEGEEHKP